MDCDAEESLPFNHPFEQIKRKLYLRNCIKAKDMTITDKILKIEENVNVSLRLSERMLYDADILESEAKFKGNTTTECTKFFSSVFNSARQVLVHHATSERLISRVESSMYKPFKDRCELYNINAEQMCLKEGRALDADLRNLKISLNSAKFILKATENSVKITQGEFSVASEI